MQDLQELLLRYKELDNYSKFASVVGDICEVGAIEQIRQIVSKEAFAFYVGVNLIGGWQSDGWGYLFAEGCEILPYTSQTLQELELLEHKICFDRLVCWLRGYFGEFGVSFLEISQKIDMQNHYEVINFLINPRFKINNAKLNSISMDDRKFANKEFAKGIGKLDEISFKIWGSESADSGFSSVSRYIKRLGL